MNKSQRLDYIFGNHTGTPVVNRFDWIETALLGDIQTFVDGIGDLVKHKRMATPTKPRGSGNVSLPILVNTGLELISALYAGTAKYRGKGYNADENVASFVKVYFPGKSKMFPRIIWDSTRNGLTHQFSPKTMRRRMDYFRFTFYVQDSIVKSKVVRNGRTLIVWFNSIEYYHVLKKSISTYKIDLKSRRDLQVKFIRSWKAMERHVRNLDKDALKRPEADFLRRESSGGRNVVLFG